MTKENKTADAQALTIMEQEDQIAALKKQNAELTARADKLAVTGGIDISTLTMAAEVAYNTRNWQAVAERDGTGDAFDTGQEVAEFKPHWPYAKPLQSALDGLYKAIHGSEYNGRKTKGALDYKISLMQALDRKMPQADTIKSYGGNTLEAVRQDPEASAILEALSQQEMLAEKLTEVFDSINDAYAIVANGEDYVTPAQRMEAYQNREKDQAERTGAMEGLLAAMKAEKAAAAAA